MLGPTQAMNPPPLLRPAAPAKRRAGLRSWVYDLIARRFLATLSPASVAAVTEAHLRVGDTEFLAVGETTVDPGWREILPDENPVSALPDLKEGDALPLREIRI